jgi:hypothetical protein
MGRVSVVLQTSAKGRVLSDAVSTKLKYEMRKRAQSAPQVKVAMEAKRDAVLREGMAYYGGMLKTVEYMLASPNMRFFRSGGRMSQERHILGPDNKLLDTGGKVTITGEGRWRKLNPQYAARKEKSTTYWHKDGGLSKHFSLLVPAAKVLLCRSNYGKSALRRLDDPKPTLAAMHMVVDYPRLRAHPEIDRLLRVSFATQSIHRVPVDRGMITPAYRATPLNHLLLAEGGPFKRPFVAKFAAQMGKAWMTALRKMERGNRV